MSEITVVVPVFNREKYLTRMIDSILSQSYKDFDLILVDDGSTDRTPEICDSYAEKDSRVTVIHKENGGVSSARNAGIEKATGRYLMFADSDDILDNEILKKLYTEAEEGGIDLVICGIKMQTIRDGKVKCEKNYLMKAGRMTVKELLESQDIDYSLICVSSPCARLFRTDIIKENNVRFDTSISLGEDRLFNIDYLMHCSTVSGSGKSLYYYIREDADSLFTRYNSDIYNIYKKIYNRERLIYEKNDCDSQTMTRLLTCHIANLMNATGSAYKNHNINKKDILKKLMKEPVVLNNITSIRITGRTNKVMQFFIKHKMTALTDLFLSAKALISCKK